MTSNNENGVQAEIYICTDCETAIVLYGKKKAEIDNKKFISALTAIYKNEDRKVIDLHRKKL